MGQQNIMLQRYRRRDPIGRGTEEGGGREESREGEDWDGGG